MIKVIVGALIGIAMFLILEDVFKIPLNGTMKSIIGLERQIFDGQSKINSSLEELAVWLSKIIHINDYKRAQMVSDLRTARLDITPEMFKANAIVKAGVIGIFAIPLFPIWNLLGILIIGVAVIMYFNEMRSLPGRIKAKRAAIEYELPRLVFTIEKTLRHSRDVLLMLESYQDIAGEDLGHEISITTADMRSGNYETAIARLESRVGSSMMSDVCRGLISVMRGDDTTVYWQSLELKFEDHQREMLKAEANKIPKKVNKLSMIMLVCFMFTWVMVIAVQVIESLGGMFG